MSHAERLRGTPDFKGKLPQKHTVRNAAIVLTSAAVISAGVYASNFFSNIERSSFLESNTDSFDGGNPVPSASPDLPGGAVDPAETTTSTAIETASPSPAPTATPEATPVATASPEPTPVPTPKPTPEATPVATPEALSPIEQKMQLAPDIEEFTKKIQTINGLERVTYINKEGKYVGEYKKEVTFEGKEVGGIVLIASEAKKRAENKTVLPVDIHDINNTSEVSVGYDSSRTDFNASEIFCIDLKNNLVSVGSVLPDRNILYTPLLGNGYTYYESEDNHNANTITSSNMYLFFNVFFKNADPEKTFSSHEKSVDFGEFLGNTSGKVYLSIESQKPDYKKISVDNLLFINDSLVFVTSANN